MKMAVVENNDKKTSSIFKQGFIATYEEDCGEWKVLSRFENTVCRATGIAAVRMALADTIKRLHGVTIIAASEISGVAFSTFEAAGFGIFLEENNVMDVLALARKEMPEVMEKQQEQAREVDIMQFFEHDLNKGDFCLNMQEVLLKNSQLTSKSILLPYLKNGEFNRLDVICSHIPPWFDRDFGVLGFEYETVNVLPDKITVRIVHAQTL